MISQRLLRSHAGARVAAVEVLLNTALVAELIEQGDLSGVKEAMEKSLAEGSQSFDADLARLITEGVVSRDEGMSHADSPTNLLWRLHNDTSPQSKVSAAAEEDDGAIFTDITLDAMPEESRAAPLDCLADPMSAALRLAEALIARRSVTPDDGGCQALIAAAAGGASASSASRCLPGPTTPACTTCGRCARAARAGPTLVFAGHTDVVPTGPLEQWAQRSVRAQPPRRPAVRPRRGRHEDLDRGDGGGLRGVRRAAARPCRRDRAS